jgi:hypothetical protein
MLGLRLMAKKGLDAYLTAVFGGWVGAHFGRKYQEK